MRGMGKTASCWVHRPEEQFADDLIDQIAEALETVR